MIGLTGAPGAGKSTVAAILAGLGCAVIDVDRLGHEALNAPEVVAEVRRVFGDRVLVAQPADVYETDAARGALNVNRAALALAVFASPTRLKHLEAIVHPWVLRRLQIELAGYRIQDRGSESRGTTPPRAVVVDCALLFESGVNRFCDTTVVVTAPRTVRARRVQRARGWSSADLRRREAAQFPAAEKRALADHVLRNGDDARSAAGRGPAALRRAATRLLTSLTEPTARASAARKSSGPETPGTRTKVKSKHAGSKPAKRKSR